MNKTQDFKVLKIREAHDVWTKQAPNLYDMVVIGKLNSYSSTFQWTHEQNLSSDGVWFIQYAIVGTSTVENNSLIRLKISTPVSQRHYSTEEYAIVHQDMRLDATSKIQIDGRISQLSDVMRARCHPNKNNIVASKCAGSFPELNIYDMSDMGQESIEPILTLEGHEAQGFGLDWNKLKNSLLVSGSSDSQICIWDIQSSKETDSSLKPLYQYKGHDASVEDVNWNKYNPHIFGSAGQDQYISVWDIRNKKPMFRKLAHKGHVYSLDFSNHSEMLLISGGEDQEVALWDLRNISKRLHTFSGHDGLVGKVQWSTHDKDLFMSSSNDSRVVIWDSTRCGEIDKYGEPAEIVFIHAGHQSSILDCDWKHEKPLIGTVDENALVHLWSMNSQLRSPGIDT